MPYPLTIISGYSYEKNRVFIPFLQDDQTVHIRPIIALKKLTSIEIETIAADETQIFQEIKNINGDIPVSKGERIRFDSGADVKITNCYPFKRGLWSYETTKVILTLTDEKTKDLLFACKYSFAFQTQSKIIFNGLLHWRNHNFTHAIEELPTNLAETLISGLAFKSPKISSSHVAFVHHSQENAVFQGFFDVWPRQSFRIPIIGTKMIDKNKIYLTPSALSNFQLECSQKATWPLLRTLPKVPQAHEVIVTPRMQYNSKLSDEALDDRIASYFSKGKMVVFNDNECVVEVPTLAEAGREVDDYLYFDLKLSDPVGSKEIMMEISSSCRLFCRQAARKPLPRCSKMLSSNSLKIIDILPSFLWKDSLCLRSMIDSPLVHNVLVYGQMGSGKQELLDSLSLNTGLQLRKYDCRQILSDTSGATSTKLVNVFETNEEFAGILVLFNVHVLAKNRDGQIDHRVLSSLEELLEEKHHYKVIGVGEKKSALESKLVQCFDQQLELLAPKQASDRLDILTWLLDQQSNIYADEQDLVKISKQTSGFQFKDLSALIAQSSMLAFEQDFDESVELSVNLDEKVLEQGLEKIQAAMADAMGAPQVPKVKWEDIGGLGEAKKEILDTIQMPLTNSSLKTISRSGILLYGPPGVGKTLLAKAVATELKLNFLSVKGPELLNMYIGQSEENVREVFTRAKTSAPAIIFFDELDALAPKRGQAGDSGGVMDRIVSQLLSELDQSSTDSDQKVFVIGATNRPDLIDPALQRPGRFDRLVYIGPPEGVTEQSRILKALTRKFEFIDEVDFERDIVEKISHLALTGADFYALTVDAMMAAVERQVKANELDQIRLCKEDFLRAIQTLKPSVSNEEMEYYKSVRTKVLNH